MHFSLNSGMCVGISLGSDDSSAFCLLVLLKGKDRCWLLNLPINDFETTILKSSKEFELLSFVYATIWARTSKPPFKTPFNWFYFQILSHWRTPLELGHMLINVLHRLIRVAFLEWFVQVINDRAYLAAFVGLILFRIICKVKILQDLLESTPCKNILSTIVANKMVAILAHRYIWQLVYCHDVICA